MLGLKLCPQHTAVNYLGPEGDIGVEIFIIFLDSVLPAILATLLERRQPADTTAPLVPTLPLATYSAHTPHT